MDEKKLIVQLKEKIKQLEYQNQILREKQEDRLQEEKARLQAITENVPGVVFQFYANNKGEAGVHYVSPKLSEIFGIEFIEDGALFFQKFSENIHEEDKQLWFESIQDVIQRQIPWEWRGRYVKPTGEIMWFDGHSIPTVRRDEIVFDGLFIDITEKIEQEAQRLETIRQQEQLKKFESLQTMAGAIAHRFNNAMMAIQGNLKLMALTLPEDSDELKMVSNAAQAASGASQVGSMMLSYVGQKKLHLHEVSLADLVRESVISLQEKFQSSVSLEFTPPDQTLSCSIDQQQIKEVLVNVLSNAVESFEPGSGAVKITFGTDYFTTSSFPMIFHDDDLKDGMYSYCQIEDNGHGISPANLSRIFEPFYTTRFVGRGLGLALAAGIMRSHHGAITVESTKGKGTTVRIVLPSSSSVSQQTISSPEAVESEERRLSGDILFADDDYLVQTVGRMMLEKLGFIVHIAANGSEAVDMVLSQDVSFCAVVLDVVMPEMDGIEAMKAIREIDPDLPILFCSGYSEGELSFKEDLGYQPDGFMEKPVGLSDMKKNLERVLL